MTVRPRDHTTQCALFGAQEAVHLQGLDEEMELSGEM
jgi:hypothetical protein